MGDDAWGNSWNRALFPIVYRDPPDFKTGIKRIVDMLRKEQPVPGWAQWYLAELLDPRQGKFDYKLVLKKRGSNKTGPATLRHARQNIQHEITNKVLGWMAAGMTKAGAIDKVGIEHRRAHRAIRDEMKRREEINAIIAQNTIPDSDKT